MSAVTAIGVDAAVAARLPRLRIAVVQAWLPAPAGADTAARVQAAWAQAWQGFRGLGLATALDHPHVAAYRAALKAAGVRVNEHPPAIESLARRALKQAQPFTVHPIVDFYNSVCLRHVTPAGAFDLDALAALDGGAIALRLSQPGDSFLAMDSDAAVPLGAGELGWFCGATALSRHFIWRQSRPALIGAGTRHLVLISEFVDGIDDGVAQAVASALARKFHHS